MKIGIDTRDLYLARTGTKTVLIELCKCFKQNKKHKVFFIEPKKEPKTPKNTIDKIISHISFVVWKQIVLPIKAKKKGVEILFCNDYVVPYFKLGFKTYPVFHGANFWEQPENYNKFWLLLMNLIAVPAARRANKILTVSEFSKNKLAQILKIKESKISVFNLAPKTFTIMQGRSSDQSEIEKQLAHQKYILHVGVMEKRKNLCRLIEGFYHSLEFIDSTVKLILVGQPSPKVNSDDSINVQNLIDTYAIQDRIIIPGYVSDSALSLYYLHADFYIFPSIYEGFGIPVLEAFQYGLPVASANVCSLPEVGGNAVYYFNPFSISEIKDTIINMSTDKNLKTALSKRGKERVKEFTWEKSSNQLINIFSSN